MHAEIMVDNSRLVLAWATSDADDQWASNQVTLLNVILEFVLVITILYYLNKSNYLNLKPKKKIK